MISVAEIGEIISLYEKHGWSLRRVLLSSAAHAELAGSDVFGAAEVRLSAIDAMWFSWPSRPGTDAWELRRISALPYALFEQISADLPENEREEILSEVESRLAETSAGH